MAFDVASVKLIAPGTPFAAGNFPLDIGDSYGPTGGRFRSVFPLLIYIDFAYKIGFTPEQIAHVPEWVAHDRYAIEARVEGKGKPTKDQMRLMMQSLLADRFKLAIHFESKEVPVFALTLVKPGKLGPKLHLHSDGPPCDSNNPGDPTVNGAPPGGSELFPSVCDTFVVVPGPNGIGARDGARNIAIGLFADFVSRFVGRPVVDKTGLTEKVDFTMEWVNEPNGPPPVDAGDPPGSQGPTMMRALREQLGLKLESTRGPVQNLVVDHVERPSEN
jgi:uncharacterized protein (TIGR03435 family)